MAEMLTLIVEILFLSGSLTIKLTTSCFDILTASGSRGLEVGELFCDAVSLLDGLVFDDANGFADGLQVEADSEQLHGHVCISAGCWGRCAGHTDNRK